MRDEWVQFIVCGVISGLVLWFLTRRGEATSSGGISGSTFNNSTLVFGGNFGSMPRSIPLVAAPVPSLVQQADRLPKRSIAKPYAGETFTKSATVDVQAYQILPRRSVDTSVTITNGSRANTVRVGRPEEVRQGEGVPIPPGQVVTFPVRNQTDLYAAANGQTQIGVIVTEINRG